MRICVFIALALCAVFGFAQPASAQGRVVVFGDSLFDNGNTSAFTGCPGPGCAVPSPPYYSTGGGQFARASNGPVSVEDLFGPLTNVTQALAASTTSGNLDFAFGGARADNAPGFPPGIPFVITSFATAGGRFGPHDTVVLDGGGNDIFQCFLGAVCNNTAAITSAATLAATSQIGNVHTLIGLGAKTILIANSGPYGNVPAFNTTPQSQSVNFAANVFNKVLASGLQQTARAAPGINIVQADFYSMFSYLSAHASAFGLANVTDACLATPSCATASLAKQNTYLFFDDYHPTDSVQQYMAEYLGLLLDTRPAILRTAPLGDVGLFTNELTTNSVFDRLTAWISGIYATKNGPYAEAIGQWASYDASGVHPGSDVNVGGIRGGLDKKIDNYLVGGSVTYLAGNESAVGLSSDVSTVRGDLYASMTAGPLYVSVDGGVSSLWLDNIQRYTGFGPLITDGNTSGYVGTAASEVGAPMHFEHVLIIPSARLTYFHSHLDGYDEQAPILAMGFEDRESDTLLGGFRLRAVSPVDIFAPCRSTAFGEIGYEDILWSDTGPLTARLINNTALPATIDPGDPGGPGFLAKLGLSSTVTAHLYLDLTYGLAVHPEGGETQSGDVRLKATF